MGFGGATGFPKERKRRKEEEKGRGKKQGCLKEEGKKIFQ